MRSAMASSRSSRRAASTTVAPDLASSSAVLSPIPEEAPVTTATAPRSSTRSGLSRARDGLPAVDDEHLAGHERRRRRAQEHGGGRDLLGPAPPSHRDLREDLRLGLGVVALLLVHGRVDPAGSDGVHADTPRGPLETGRLR